MGSGKGGKLLVDTMVDVKGCSGGLCVCKTVHEVKNGKYKGLRFGGSFPNLPRRFQTQFKLKDYFQNYGEAFALVGAMNRYGICSTTCLNMISFVVSLCERGVISKKDMGKPVFEEGDSEFYLALIEKIVNKEDFGAVMAEGWHPLGEAVGIDIETDPEPGCAITKGIDLIVDARLWPSLLRPGSGFSPCMGLSSIVQPKSKHTHSATYWTQDELSLAEVKNDAEKMGITKEERERIFSENSFDTGRLEKYAGEAETTYNILGICDTVIHWAYDPMRDIPWLAEAYTAATGFDITPRELLRAGERSFNIEKLLNAREGFTREDDKIPPVYLQNTEIPIQSREGKRYLTDWFGKRLSREDLENILDNYYEERGWDIEKGVPTKKKLVELGLEDLAGILETL